MIVFTLLLSCFSLPLVASTTNIIAQEQSPREAAAPVSAPNPYARLIESRIKRQSSLLDPKNWTVERRSGLAMQEYLMTLGQNGEPGNAKTIAEFFDDPVLQGSALFAYGELHGADAALLFNVKARDENLPLLAESISKTARPDQFEMLVPIWEKFSEDVRNKSLFYFWRNNTDTLTGKVTTALDQEIGSDKTGYIYYLYRARITISASLLTRILNGMTTNPQGLIYATRILVDESSAELEASVTDLVSDSDWRIRVNALNLMGRLGNQSLIKKHGMAALKDPNPGVVYTAIRLLIRLEDDEIDKKLAAKYDVLSDANMFAMVLEAKKERAGRFLKNIKSWQANDDSWRRARWLSVQDKESDNAALDKKLSKMLNGWRWEQGTPGEKALALRTLIQRNPKMAEQAIIETFEEGDPYLMAIATNALARVGDKWPISMEILHKAASRFYTTTDYHQAYIQLIKEKLPETEWRKNLEKLQNHPDYLVRLRALEASGDTAEKRHAIHERGWRHQISPEITEPASTMLAGTGKTYHWILETEKGPITIKLQTAYAPITCASMIYQTHQGYFNDMPIHRVVPNFVVQMGDNRGDGSGGPGYNIPCEINPLRFRKGAVGMALSGKDSGGGQFFICHSDQPHLDGGYTVFGHVIKGINIVSNLQEGDRIITATIVQKQD